jgi:hypothetical protein
MNVRNVLFALLMSTLPVTAGATDELYGTWKLVSFTRNILETGQKIDLFGKAPKGFLNYGRDGRMYAILVKDERLKPADMSKVTDAQRLDLFNTMSAYAGTFSVDGNKVTHHVDISWNENWTGTAQVRNIKLAGRRLYIETNPQLGGIDGKMVVLVLEWEKLGAL